jgi:hypothetical protein
MPGYADALAALTDAELEAMLERRPDLRAGQPPVSFPELASRAGGPASIAAACAGLDAGTLQLAELIALIGLPTSIEALAHAAGPGLSDDELDARLARLAGLGLALPGEDGTVSGPPGLAAGFERPGRLGPGVADLAKVELRQELLSRIAAHYRVDAAAETPEAQLPALPGVAGVGERGSVKAGLVRAVATVLSDPAAVAASLREAPPAARKLLDRVRASDAPVTVWTAGPARNAGDPDAEPADWLTGRGLLLPIAYSQFVVPREVELALRGGWVFPDWPGPPGLAAPEPAQGATEAAEAAATRFVLAAEALATNLDVAPLELIRSGTVAVRDLRRLAKDLELSEPEASFLLDLAVAAGLVVPGGPWGSRTLGLAAAADDWLAMTRAARWAALAVAWRDTPVTLEEHLAAAGRPARPADEQPRPLSLPSTARAVERRRAVLELVGRLPAGRGVGAASFEPVLAWDRPVLWRAEGDQVGAVLAAAALIGVGVNAKGRIARGLGLGPWLAGRAAGELAAAATGALPDGAREFLVAGDLTVVAPGGLAPDLDARLSGMAERVSGGTSASWRIDQASLQRAFDTGLTAGEVLEFLNDHSRTPLPQALEYLVADAERQHGRLRIGGATTYLRGDAAVVTGLVRSAAGRRLGLRELAPGVAVSSKPQREVLAGLRKAGEAPVAEAPDGTPRTEAPRPVRHPGRPAPGTVLRPDGPVPSLPASELVVRLRKAAGIPAPEPLRPGRPRLASAVPGRRMPAGPQARGAGSASTVLARPATPDGNGLVTAPAEIAELCLKAVEDHSAVEIAYDGVAGETVRAIEPLRIQAGRVHAYCRLREAERTFALSRISWARPYPDEVDGDEEGDDG